jgi:hypothetical protein
MSATIEERVAMLEKELTKLKQLIQDARVAKIGGKHSVCLPTTRDSMR